MPQRLPGAHPDAPGTTFVAWSTAPRRLVVTFGDRDHAIAGAEGARVLFASGAFELGRLTPRSAVVLAND